MSSLIRPVLVAAALLACVAPAAYAGGGEPGEEPPGIHCEIVWGEMPQPTSEPLPVPVPWPSGMQCH